MRVAFGDFVFDSDTRELLCGGNRVTLSPKAFQLLEVLIENRPRALSKSVLLNRLWENTFVVEANLSNLVGEIRHALGEDSRTPQFVRTVHRFGYAFQCVERNPEHSFHSDDELGSHLGGSAAIPLPPGHDRSSGNNLPQQLTRFIGRQGEIAAVRSLVSQTRLTTLCGAGGIGKTRLALEVAHDTLDEYADGVWLVEFASISDPQLIPQTVAAALSLREERGWSITDAVASYLKSRNLLLVLDNCEHVIGAIAQLADVLLRNCPNLRILATSRESLAIAGETLFRVPPLSLPDTASEAARLGKHEAVELFVERVRAVNATFVLNESNAALVAKVCIHLEGIPLAIELAASRLKVLSVEQIAGRLGDRLKLLRGGSRSSLPRHQTLLAAIDWSYNLLSETEKTLFRRLAVFSGGWTLEAAENVCLGEPVDKDNLLELLSGLIDKSLVLLDGRDGQQRYRFMMTLLEYAQERLAKTQEAAAIYRAHAGFFNALVLQGESRSMSAGENTWLDRIKLEYDNIRSALSWTSKEEPEAGIRIAAALWRFWYLNGYLQEGRRWLEEMLTRQPGSTDDVIRAKAINRLAVTAVLQGDGATAQTLATQALSVARESAGRSEAAFALNTMAIIAGEQCNFPAARALLEESLGIRRELGDRALTANTLNNLGILSFRQGEFEVARAFYEQSLASFREVGDRHGMAMTLLNQGELAIRSGDRSGAQLKIQEGLTLAKELKDRSLIPVAMNTLGKMLLSEGNDLAASQLINETLDVFRDLGDKHRIATTLVTLGTLAEHRGCDADAQSLYEESVALCRELGDPLELATSLNCLGRLAARQGDHAAARAHCQEALTITQQVGSKPGIARSLSGLADLARLKGDYATASSLYKESLAAWRDLNHTPESLQTLESIATVMIASGQSERSVRIFGAAQAVREATSVPRSTHETPDYNRKLSAARNALGEPRFAALWKDGQTMDSDTAIAMALEE